MALTHGSPALTSVLARRSVSPKRLGGPGPTPPQLEAALAGALRAPDHGGLRPWRVIHFPAAQRAALAQLFAAEKLRRDPLASDDDLARAREHALNAPTLLAFVVGIRSGTTIPAHEQWLAAGAALGNLLNAFHALGFGAIVLSGDRCADAVLAAALGLDADEQLVGFVSAGTILKPPPPAPAASPGSVLSDWSADRPLVPSDPHRADMPSENRPTDKG